MLPVSVHKIKLEVRSGVFVVSQNLGHKVKPLFCVDYYLFSTNHPMLDTTLTLCVGINEHCYSRVSHLFTDCAKANKRQQIEEK